jgi:hypothetical protein
MLDCKSLATPLVPKLKLFADLDSDLVDPRQLMGNILHFVNTWLDSCFAMISLR